MHLLTLLPPHWQALARLHPKSTLPGGATRSGLAPGLTPVCCCGILHSTFPSSSNGPEGKVLRTPLVEGCGCWGLPGISQWRSPRSSDLWSGHTEDSPGPAGSQAQPSEWTRTRSLQVTWDQGTADQHKALSCDHTGLHLQSRGQPRMHSVASQSSHPWHVDPPGGTPLAPGRRLGGHDPVIVYDAPAGWASLSPGREEGGRGRHLEEKHPCCHNGRWQRQWWQGAQGPGTSTGKPVTHRVIGTGLEYG